MFVDLTADHPLWSEAMPVLQQLRPHLTPDLLAQIVAEGTRRACGSPRSSPTTGCAPSPAGG